MYRQLSPIALCLYLYLCGTPPLDLDLSLTRPTAHGLYAVDLPPLTEPVPADQLHGWEVRVALPGGQPVLNAGIGVDGGMPQHGHGLPTQPRVVREVGEGRYPVEGMKFGVTGRWEIKLKVRAGATGADQITVNRVIVPPTSSSA